MIEGEEVFKDGFRILVGVNGRVIYGDWKY